MTGATRAQGGRPEPSVRRALLLSLASAVLPGSGLVAAGRRRAGWSVLGLLVVLVAVGAVLVLRSSSTGLLQLAVQQSWLDAVMLGALVLAALWAAVITATWLAARPAGLRGRSRVVAGALVAAICLVAVAPLALAARYAYVQRDLISNVFAPTAALLGASGAEPGAGAPSPSPGQPDPWAGQRRLNVLLLGGDGGVDRTGVRTDSITVASIDTHTGRTVLLSLPRNLEGVPFAPGTPMAKRFPHGFDDLLDAVYTYASNDPTVAPKGVANPGAAVLEQTVGHILGLQIDNYVLVNLGGFRRIVNALGGVTVRVERRIPIGGIGPNGEAVRPTGYIRPGLQKLDGEQALWYGRSRTNSDDYVRMGRQRCLLGAMAHQLDPVTVLRRYQQIAAATKDLVATDLPRDRLPALVGLADLVRKSKLRSLQFVPPLIYTGNPDFALIRAKTQAAIASSESNTHSKHAGRGRPVSVDSVCRYS